MPRTQHRKPRISTWSLAARWRQTNLKFTFEISICDEQHDAVVARIHEIANAAFRDIEAAITVNATATFDDPQAFIDVRRVLRPARTARGSIAVEFRDEKTF